MEVLIENIAELSNTYDDLEKIGFITYTLRSSVIYLYEREQKLETKPYVSMPNSETMVCFDLADVDLPKNTITYKFACVVS